MVKAFYGRRQITATFAVSVSEEFLPIRVIYEGKTTRCLPKYAFPENFDIKFPENHSSNTEKTITIFKKLYFLISKIYVKLRVIYVSR